MDLAGLDIPAYFLFIPPQTHMLELAVITHILFVVMKFFHT
jgi:hypothetical protein